MPEGKPQGSRGDNSARYAPPYLAAYAAMLQLNGRALSQQDAAEFLEDWPGYWTAFHDGEAMSNPGAVIAAVRNITIEALRKAESSVGQLSAQQSTGAAIRIGDTDLGGTVTGPQGPEAGVWVIAETTDLPTRFAKIVVTDAQGRYVLPDLPKATYSVWVRGYGLVDSPKVRTEPGKVLNLTAVPAPNEAAAAQYYPAIY